MTQRSSALARGVAAVLLTASLPVLAAAVPAGTATAAPRCTIVGTSSDDRLVGTAGRDVICGLGGDDRILGRGGDDLLLGGGGRDRLVGGPGADRLDGGRSGDVADGGRGDDVVLGGGGRDRALGGAGDDRLLGGSAGDVLEGDGGSDTVLGGAGNDDLAGGPKADRVDGGPGTNWCLLDAADRSDQCVYDRKPAVAHEVRVSARSVDVTLANRAVTVRVHVTDDTGVQAVSIRPGEDTPWFPTTWPRLTSGDVRDGWWTATLTLQRWSLPGTYAPKVTVLDRLNRRSVADFPGSSVAVRNSTPDTELPEVTLESPATTTTYDVRTKSAQVTFRTRIVDRLSGVDDVSVNLWSPDMRFGYGMSPRRTSGTIRDGIWTGTLDVAKGQVGGDWNFEIVVSDRARRDSGTWLRYWGPGAYRLQHGDPEAHRPLPFGRGSITVLGRQRTDFTAPTIASASVTPSTVDTLPGPVSVSYTVNALDNASGVDGILAELLPAEADGSEPMYLSDNPSLTSGTATSGTWTGTITLPQGLPPGAYYLKVYVWDREGNGTSYLASGHPDAEHWPNRLSGNPVLTVIDSSP